MLHDILVDKLTSYGQRKWTARSWRTGPMHRSVAQSPVGGKLLVVYPRDQCWVQCCLLSPLKVWMMDSEQLSNVADDTKLWGVGYVPGGCAAIQRGLGRQENWADRNLIRLNKGKCKVLQPGEGWPHAPVRAGTPLDGKQLCREGHWCPWWPTNCPQASSTSSGIKQPSVFWAAQNIFVSTGERHLECCVQFWSPLVQVRDGLPGALLAQADKDGEGIGAPLR